MRGLIRGGHGNLGSGLVRREVESMVQTAGCCWARGSGLCWRNDLCIRGRNTRGTGITGVRSPRCARTPSTGRQARSGTRSADVLAQHETPSGQGRGFGACKETRDSALAFNQDVRSLPFQAPRIWTSAPARVYATTPGRRKRGGPTASRSPSCDQGPVRWAAWARRRVPAPTPGGYVRQWLLAA